MCRANLYSCCEYDLRLHVFKDVNEVVVHNHKKSFLSLCISGSYKHQLWNLSKRGPLYKFLRNSDDLIERNEESCSQQDAGSHDHIQGDSFFLNHEVFPALQPTKLVTW